MKKVLSLPVLAVIALLIMASAGAAYAYSSSLRAGSGVSAESHSIDLLDKDGNELSGPVIVPIPQHVGLEIIDTSYTIEGKLKVDWNDSPAQLRAWIQLEPQSYIYIDSIELVFDGEEIELTLGGNTGNASELIDVDTGVYDYSITFDYADTVPALKDDQNRDIFQPIRFTFAAGTQDPFSA